MFIYAYVCIYKHTHIYTCICIHIYIPKFILFGPYNNVCIQGWPFGIGQPISVLFPGEDQLFHFPVAYSFLYKIQILGYFLIYFGMSIGGLVQFV